MTDLVIINARLFETGDELSTLLIRDGVIRTVSVSQTAGESTRTLDAGGQWVLPVPTTATSDLPILDLSENRAVAARTSHAVRFGLETEPFDVEAERIDTYLEATSSQSVRIENLTTRAGLDTAVKARRHGRDIQISVPVTHLFFNDIDTVDLNPHYRLSPPLQNESDRQALLDAIRLGEVDEIDAASQRLASHYKDRPFSDALPGSFNAPYLIPALCTLALNEGIDLDLMLRPAVHEGLAIRDGQRGDLLIFDPDAPVSPSHFKDIPYPSAFAGRRLTGKVLHSLSNGEIVSATQP